MAVLLPQVVGTECNVENVARRDARRVGVRMVRSEGGNADEDSSMVRRTTTSQWPIDGGKDIAAIQTDLLLLIACQSQRGRVIRNADHDQPAVESPGEARP